MHLIIALLALSIPLSASEDLTHLIDAYYTEGFAHYTNKSDIPLRCQISAKIDESLPFGTLAEKRNVTIRGYLSYTHRRWPTEQIIFCTRLVEEKDASEHE
jgi:hypothetical protein